MFTGVRPPAAALKAEAYRRRPKPASPRPGYAACRVTVPARWWGSARGAGRSGSTKARCPGGRTGSPAGRDRPLRGLATRPAGSPSPRGGGEAHVELGDLDRRRLVVRAGERGVLLADLELDHVALGEQPVVAEHLVRTVPDADTGGSFHRRLRACSSPPRCAL